MSICRWGDADVYIFEHVHGGFVCCACALQHASPSSDELNKSEDEDYFHVDTAEEMLLHMQEHIAAGDRIPDEAIKTVSNIINKES